MGENVKITRETCSLHMGKVLLEHFDVNSHVKHIRSHVKHVYYHVKRIL